MRSSFAKISRRNLLFIACSAICFASSAALADKNSNGKIAIDELMAANALPDIVEGNASAPITIVEYASMTCSHCAAFHHDVLPELKKNFIETGKIKFILREFPLDPLATAAFMLARELGEKRNAVVDLLFLQQKNWAFTDKPLDGLANVLKQTGMGQEKFETILKDQALFDKINKIRDRASEKFGVNSTPTFFINGERYTGEINYADFEKIIATKSSK